MIASSTSADVSRTDPEIQEGTTPSITEMEIELKNSQDIEKLKEFLKMLDLHVKINGRPRYGRSVPDHAMRG